MGSDTMLRWESIMIFPLIFINRNRVHIHKGITRSLLDIRGSPSLKEDSTTLLYTKKYLNLNKDRITDLCYMLIGVVGETFGWYVVMPCLMLYDNYKNIFLLMVSFGLDIYTQILNHNFFEQSLVCFRYELNSD